MTEIDDFDRHTLLTQRHCHWREDKGRRRVTRQIRLLQFRPAVETHRLKNALAGHLFVDEIGHRAGEMTGDWQKSDPEFVWPGSCALLGTKQVKID